MKRFLANCCIVAAMLCLAAQPAVAARIYNFLPMPVLVAANPLLAVPTVVQPGQRSDSLSWPAALSIGVTADPAAVAGTAVCSMGFGGHADIQGGNYLTIGHQGNLVICTLCDSNHQVMRTDRHTWTDPLRNNKLRDSNSRTGC